MKPFFQVALVVAIVAAVAGGLFLTVRASTSGGRLEILLPTVTPETPAELKVYVTGAVRRTGVYTVAQGSRLEQVVEAAGGATDDADLAAVNLALLVRDEQHWHIPRQGEPAPAQQPAGSAPSATIDLNSATAGELMALDGIGETLAKRIVDYREANGPFSSVEELLDVRGIGPTILGNNRHLVEVR